MLGLALGSWLGGKYISSLVTATQQPAILFYAIVECLIGIGGISVPLIFRAGQALLLPAGDFNSFHYLLLSACILAISVLPWCLAIGSTIPFAMAFIKDLARSAETGFSYLYLANVIGAMFGVLITAFLLIEVLGLHTTLYVAACCNLTISLVAYRLGVKSKAGHRPAVIEQEAIYSNAPVTSAGLSRSNSLLFYSILLITGFSSMAFEVVWTRAFTPVMSTTIYAFAGILAVYLLATWLGSLLYRTHSAKRIEIDIPVFLALLLAACSLPIVGSNVRLWRFTGSDIINIIIVLSSIFPFCCVLGYITPKLIDTISRGNPRAAGNAYAVNTLGCILGPLAAGYLLLPTLGLEISLIILAVPFVIYLISFNKYMLKYAGYTAIFMGALVMFLCASAQPLLTGYSSYESGRIYKNGVIRRDYVATTISYGEGMNKRLLVNGIGMTSLTPITKFMAHVPLSLRQVKHDSALVICFGMGTTFRSAATWNIKVTAVELVPGVRDSFGFYFNDADAVLKRAGVQIIVDDGRRFLRRTSEVFDVIAIDPPPPISSSGSSLLYSEQFYQAIKLRLKSDGILAQWLPASSQDAQVTKGVLKSICDEFPYVKMFGSVEGWGYHFFASREPFKLPDANAFVRILPRAAADDFVEWNRDKTPGELYQQLLDKEIPIGNILTPDVNYSVSDDRPINEYFLLRHLFKRVIKM
jgi:predicted membrane-bound spermidine synthase